MGTAQPVLCSPSPPASPPPEDRRREVREESEPEPNSRFSRTFSSRRGSTEGRRHQHMEGSGRDDEGLSWKDR